mgnify:CR=1 FL=1
MKISCAIVDDNIESVKILKSHVAKVPYLNLIGGYTNAVEAMKGFREHSIDLLFMGIRMRNCYLRRLVSFLLLHLVNMR